MNKLIVAALILLLAACGRDKEPIYYVLNPAYTTVHQKMHSLNLKLGIDAINVPDYLDKSQLALFCSANQSKLTDNHQWAERLPLNIRRVVKTNLSERLSNTWIELSPWSSIFTPTYHLQIDISQFKVDESGDSVLYASYTFYTEKGLLLKKHVRFYQHLNSITPETMVNSMNANLTKLTEDIVVTWRRVR